MKVRGECDFTLAAAKPRTGDPMPDDKVKTG